MEMVKSQYAAVFWGYLISWGNSRNKVKKIHIPNFMVYDSIVLKHIICLYTHTHTPKC